MSKESSQVVISKKMLILLLILLLLILGAFTVLLVHSLRTPASPTAAAVQTTLPDIDANAEEWNGQQLPDKTEDPPKVGIKIPGYPSIGLPAGQTTVAAALVNPEGNPCYFTFELVLKTSGESLYKSRLVPPGQAITEMTLTRPLDAGEYAATLKITTTSLTDGSAMNGANVETTLIVK